MGPAVVLPSATGMALTLVLLSAAAAPEAVRAAVPASDAAAATAVEHASDMHHHHHQQQQQQQVDAALPGGAAVSNGSLPLPRFVVWSRLDQKTCLKSITAANLVPVVVELRRRGDELVTDVAGIAAAIEQLGPSKVAAVVTTTSCFAPR
jgi:O-phospho-L-seryl-tRNASec:L-selenocysteinyl-tRNA synthase